LQDLDAVFKELEICYERNQQLRAEFANDPAKYFDSEADLYALIFKI
jgi:hypothetical protein